MCNSNSVQDRLESAADSNERFDIATEVIPQNNVVRIYDRQENHVLSILPCLDGDGFDLTNPDGKVLHCGVHGDLVKAFVDCLGLEEL
jgi:hypothetical protein